MGCDIHMYIEKYSDEDYNGPKPIEEHRDDLINDILKTKKESILQKRWITADVWVYDPKYDLDDDYEYYGEWIIPYEQRIYSDRNYLLFSILAGVRNWGENIMICKPKGIPEDASYPYLKEVEDWGSDGHSHSYFTLKELQEVDFIELTKDSKYESSGISFALKSIIKLMDNMSKIEKDPECVRICFFFDN